MAGAPLAASLRPSNGIRLQRALTRQDEAVQGRSGTASRADTAGPSQRSGLAANIAPPIVTEALRSAGHPLEDATRAWFEPRFGHDFSRVRLHTDSQAARSAQAVRASAYTVGTQIMFGPGRYEPGTTAGRELLAHELAHVVQQRGATDATGAGLQLNEDNDQAEREADTVAHSLAAEDPGPMISARGRAGRTRIAPSSRPVVARQPAKAPVNDPHRLGDAVSVEQLFALYATNEDRFIIGQLPPYRNPEYTKAWIRGAGERAIRAEITRRLAGQGQAERIRLLNYIDGGLRAPAFDETRLPSLLAEVGTSLPLTHDQRVELRRLVGDRLTRAHTVYTNAAAAVAAALKAAANAEAAMLGLILDVFMGLAAPGLARGIAAVADSIPAAASNATYRVALAALDERRTSLVLAAATKIGKQAIVSNASPLFGETDIDQFIRGLKKAFNIALDDIDKDLPNRTDDELGVLYGTYDPAVADEDHYIALIKDLTDRFRRQVRPIGAATSVAVTDPVDRTITRQTGLVWAQQGADLWLTQVTLEHSSLDAGSRMYFQTFVEKDLEDPAINRARPNQPRGIQVFSSRQIENFPSSVTPGTARR